MRKTVKGKTNRGKHCKKENQYRENKKGGKIVQGNNNKQKNSQGEKQ